MIRAKELERRLPRGALRREPGKKGRYQLLLRNLDAATVYRLTDPLWEVFGAAKMAKAETDVGQTTFGVIVTGRWASAYRDGQPFAFGHFRWLDGTIDLTHHCGGGNPMPSGARRKLEQQVQQQFSWKPA